jgi:hypothetical protein
MKLAVFMIAVGALICVPTASATAVLILDDGIAADLRVVTDGGGGDANGAPGAVTFVGAVGANWFINVSTGITKPSAIAPTVMDLNSVNTSLGAGTLKIYFYENDFTILPPAFELKAGGTVNPNGGSIDYKVFGNAGDPTDIVECSPGVKCVNSDPNPPAFAAGTVQVGGTISAVGPGAFSGVSFGTLAGVSVPPGYALAQMLTIVHAAGGTSSGNFELTSVPEPAAIVLLGGILLVTVNAIRRKAVKA